MGSLLYVDFEVLKDFKLKQKVPEGVEEKRKAVDKVAQLFFDGDVKKGLKELKKASQETPCGSVFTLRGRAALNDAVVGANAEVGGPLSPRPPPLPPHHPAPAPPPPPSQDLSDDKRRAILSKGVKDALELFVEGAAGAKCRSVTCLYLALGLILDVNRMLDGVEERSKAFGRLVEVYFEAEEKGVAREVAVDPPSLDAIPGICPDVLIKR